LDGPGAAWIRIYVADISRFDAAALDRLAADGSPANRPLSRRRKQSLVGRALAGFAIEDCVGMSADDQRYESTEHGKPVCVGGPPFSLSHCQDWVVCALASSGDIGVDLQFPTAHTHVDEIAARCFGSTESAWVRAGDRSRFFMLWTLKEAYLKAIGLGVPGGLASVQCRIEPPTIDATFDACPPLQLTLYACNAGFLSIAASVSTEVKSQVVVWQPGAAAALTAATSAPAASAPLCCLVARS
jgi:phosphopantetheinyl transferase